MLRRQWKNGGFKALLRIALKIKLLFYSNKCQNFPSSTEYRDSDLYNYNKAVMGIARILYDCKCNRSNTLH